MATLKEPFALDRSLNTTEVTPRNIADVLAEGLSHITGRTASEVEYDNTDSGLTSDDVQGAIDELSERPTLPTTDIQTAVDEFSTYNGGLLSECIIELVPVQSGSGDPSPDNVRPISGHTQVEVDVSDGQTTQEQVTVNLGGTYYSGTLDVVSGVFTPDMASVDLGTLTWTYEASWGVSSDFYAVINNALNIKRPDTQDDVANAICTQYKMVSRNEFYDSADSNIAILPTPYIKIRDSRYNDGTAFQSAMNGVMLVYELATPTPIQLSPTMVKALVGENHLSAPLDGQEITESEYRELFTWDEVEAYVNAHSGSGMNYSTEEQVVGTWIDGKPLYQKTFVQQLSGTTGSIDLSSLNISEAFIYGGFYDIGVTNLELNEWLTQNDKTYAHVNKGFTPPVIDMQCTFADAKATITLQYTKTTD